VETVDENPYKPPEESSQAIPSKTPGPLVEALVVLAFLGILMALKLPAISRAGAPSTIENVFTYALVGGIIFSGIWLIVQVIRWLFRNVIR